MALGLTIRGALAAVLTAMVLSGTALAQVQVGDNTKMNLDGNLWFGYNGSSTDTPGTTSQHSIDVGGTANLTGSYYNPNFLSFMVQPYYGRTSDNSSQQTITASNGVNATVGIFSGSRFPGTLSYVRANNSTGTFGLLDQNEGVTTHGNSQAFTIGWSALVPDWPTFSVNFTDAGGTAEVYGAKQQSDFTTRTLNLRSTYTLEGFNLTGYFTRLSQNTSLPMFLTGGSSQTDTVSNNYGVTASHRLPMRGTFSADWNHFSFNDDYSGGVSSGKSNTLDAMAVLSPTQKLGLSFTTQYTDNLSAEITRAIVETGATPVEIASPDVALHSVNVNFGANYSLTRNLSVQGNVSRQEQFAPGYNYGATRASGTVNFGYSKPLFGILSFSVGAVDTATEQGNTGASLIGTVNATKRFGRWETTADFSYSQAVQTLLATYTTSSYSYGANARRRFGKRDFITGSFRGYRTGFTRDAGSGNHAENYFSTLILGRYSFSANYSQSNGISIFSTAGLTPVPIDVVPGVLPGDLVLYQGRSYGGSFGSEPIRNLTVTASFTRALSHTTSPTQFSSNSNSILNLITRYRLRKVLVTGGYTRLNQGISASGLLPVTVSSYYFGISRWFNFF